MKTKSINFIIALFVALSGRALGQDFKEVAAKEIQRYEKNLETSKLRLKNSREGFKEKTAEIQQLRKSMEKLKATRSRRKEKISAFKERLESAKKDLPWLKRRFSGEGRTLGCLIKAVKDQKELSRCGGVDEIDGDLREEVKRFDEGLGLSDQNYKRVLSRKKTALERASKHKVSYEKRIPIYEARLESWKDQIVEAKKDIQYYEEFKNRATDAYGCGPSTQTLDLEADAQNSGLGREGVFYGLGRDHQNGLGTCFANTAKNLLYAATDGEVNASFLDIALQYKDDQTADIEGGGSCPALSRLHESGYCEKSNSPLETGKRMPATGLINGVSDVSGQAYMMDLLGDFLKGNNSLKREGLDGKVAKNVPRLIQALRSDPLIELPMPSIGLEPVSQNKVNEYFYWGYPEDKRGDLKYEAFKEEFKKVKDKFELAIANEIRANENFSLDALAQKIVEPFLKKHHVNKKWRDKILVSDLDKKLDGLNREKYLRKLDSTLRFIGLMDGRIKEKTEFDFEDFLSPSCRADSERILNFGAALEDLVEYIEEQEIDAMVLAGENGFKANRELLQLAIAPNCANKNNRKPSPDVYCQAFNVQNGAERFGVDKKEFTRFRALKQLKKGLPVGNSYQTNRGWHINTIVGFRYNPRNKKCEYKIRESQTAQGFWMDEQKLSNRISRMTVVDK